MILARMFKLCVFYARITRVVCVGLCVARMKPAVEMALITVAPFILVTYTRILFKYTEWLGSK